MPGRRTVVVLVAALAVGVAVMSLAAGRHDRRASAGAPDDPALRTLHTWDASRAAAYASGSVAALRDLYVPGSAAGRADLRVLRAYRARRLRVTGMRMQVLALSVLDSRRGWWRLQVTDRLAEATVMRGHRRITLPSDRPTTRILTMMRGGDGRWRVADVEDTGV